MARKKEKNYDFDSSDVKLDEAKSKKKRKKKREKKTELVAVHVKEKVPDSSVVKKKRGRPPSLKKKEKELTKIVNVFGGDAKKIQKLLRNNEDDSAILKSQRSLLNMLVDLIPIAENTYREFRTERAAYAMNAFISQMRELMQDIVSSQDRALAADTIIHNIIKPSMISFAQFILDNNYQLNKELSEIVPVERAKDVSTIVNKSSRNIGVYMETLMKDFSDRIKAELSE